MSQQIKIFQNDTSPNPQFTITRTDGSIVDLSGCTVRFRIQDPISGILTNTNTNNQCVITDAGNGKCTYKWNDTDLPDAGSYPANLQITYPTLDPEGQPQVETYGFTIQVTAIV
jgi:hypothetical protein